MSKTAINMIKNEIAKKQKQLRGLVQDRDMHQRMADNCAAAVELHQSELFDLIDALETLGGSLDDTV